MFQKRKLYQSHENSIKISDNVEKEATMENKEQTE